MDFWVPGLDIFCSSAKLFIVEAGPILGTLPLTFVWSGVRLTSNNTAIQRSHQLDSLSLLPFLNSYTLKNFFNVFLFLILLLKILKLTSTSSEMGLPGPLSQDFRVSTECQRPTGTFFPSQQVGV